jgi:hypothetical protein
MSVSADYLLRCSAETGFQADTLERVVRLAELAAEIARHPRLGTALILKGGTPLNLGYGPPTRLSVDLDYNYVEHVDRDLMLAARPEIESAAIGLATRLGYDVQSSPDAFAGRKLTLRYRSALGPAGLLQVDVNYLHRLPLDEPTTLALWQPGELDQPAVTTVAPSELLAGKLLALLDRGSPRDAWDVAHLPATLAETCRQPRLRQLFLAMATTLDRTLASYRRQRLQAFLTERLVAEQLRPMLAAGQRLDAASLAEAAWRVVASLVDLSAGETAYFAAVDEGALRLDLLFPGEPDEAARLARHPALQWKLVNVRRRRTGG